jgi:leucine dehydrogenase
VRHLLDAGARVEVADPEIERLGSLPEAVGVVRPDEILARPCDVLVPCGPAHVIGRELAARLACSVVCGAANNTLADPDAARILHERGVLYVPDYLANAGGLIHLAVAREGGDPAASQERLRVIPENLERLLAHCQDERIDPVAAAEHLIADALAA